MVYKLLTQIPYRPLHLALILGIVRMGVERFYAMGSTPPIPLPSEGLVVCEDVLWPACTHQGMEHFLYFAYGGFMVPLLREDEVSTVIIYAHYEPVSLTLDRVRPFDVQLPEFVGLLRPEELPSFAIMRIPVDAMLLEDVIDGGPRQPHLLDALNGLSDVCWQTVEALLNPRGAPFKGASQSEDGDFHVYSDLALFRSPRRILEAFPAPVIRSLTPSVDRLPSGVKERS